MARRSTQLGQVASGFATQSLWLADRKVRSQVIGEDQTDSLEEEQLGKLGKEKNEEEEPATERRREYTDVGSNMEERDKHVAWHTSALEMADEA